MTSVAAWSVARCSCLVCPTDDLDLPDSSQALCLSADDVGVGDKHLPRLLAECVLDGDIESSSVETLAGCLDHVTACFDDHVASLALTPTGCVDFENCASALGASVWASHILCRARSMTPLVDLVDEALLAMKGVDYLS